MTDETYVVPSLDAIAHMNNDLRMQIMKVMRQGLQPTHLVIGSRVHDNMKAMARFHGIDPLSSGEIREFMGLKVVFDLNDEMTLTVLTDGTRA